MTNLQDLYEKTIAISRQAGALIQESSGQIQSYEFKSSAKDIVTNVDREVEKFLIDQLSEILPSSGFLGEEFGQSGSEKAYQWVIDPIDGTTNFFHSFPQYCVSIGLIYESDIQLGVVYNPASDELFSALKSQGSFLNGKRIFVSSLDHHSQSLIATGFPYDFKAHKAVLLEQLGRVLEAVQDIRRAGAAALDLCYVACGRLDGYYEYTLHPWDMAAGVLILMEAGGSISLINGDAFSLFQNQVLATNGHIHQQMVTLLQ